MGRFDNKRVLITSANLYMGPAISERFRAEGATVLEDNGTYENDPTEPARIMKAASPIDILVINLIATPAIRPAAEASEAEWQEMFARLAHPTMRFIRAALPDMIERKAGKIIVVTSAAPLRPVQGASAYTAARGAQNAYIAAVGAEVARHNVQINAIAQANVYGGFPRNYLDQAENREQVARDVPAGRLAEGWEQAELVLFLASPNSNFISGQVVPYAGGWAT